MKVGEMGAFLGSVGICVDVVGLALTFVGTDPRVLGGSVVGSSSVVSAVTTSKW